MAHSLLYGTLTLSLAAIRATACHSAIFEPDNFDVAHALFEHGIQLPNVPLIAQSSIKQRAILGCSTACQILEIRYGSDAVYTSDESAYIDFSNSYWSEIQAETLPRCIFTPENASQVSAAVLVSRATNCSFAARSGGHAAFSGASSIQGGIVISFEKLKGISLSSDKKIARIQPGNIWGEVYQFLETQDLSVVGGRVYDIGVGGLTTGGGISYFTNLHGFACDNVESFDVVTASGKIVHADASQNSDLYWALRGGGNNFGLVTSFNLWTIPLPGGSLWGGSRIYLETSFGDLEHAFSEMASNASQDPKAFLLLGFGIMNRTHLGLSTMSYTEPDGGGAAIWANLNKIPAISDTTQNRTLSAWTEETMGSNPKGLRQVYYVVSVKADMDILTTARDLLYSTFPEVADVPGVFPTLIIQSATVPAITQMLKYGGNTLGLDPAEGPVYIIQLGVMWDNKEDDAAVYRWVSKVLTGVRDDALARGRVNDFVYMNYASQFQDVISSYGVASKAKLKNVAKKYDPTGVFQTLQPGYFKLDRAPITNSGLLSF